MAPGVLGWLAFVLALESGVEVDWTAPLECPNGVEIATRVGELTTNHPDQPLLVSAVVHIRGGNYVLDLEWRHATRHETEQLVGHDCDELGELAAVLLASELDPFAFTRFVRFDGPRRFERQPEVAEAVEPEPVEPEPVEPQSVEPQSVEPQSVEPNHAGLPHYDVGRPPPRDAGQQRRPRSSVNGLVLAEGHGFLNLLPNPGGGPRLGIALELSNARLVLAGAGWFASGFRSPSDPTVGGRLSAWSIELHGCGVPHWRRLSVPLCGQLGAGQALGTGFGVDPSLSASQPWVWLGADANLEWWVHPRFALRAGLGVGFSLVRPSFEIVGSDARFEFPIVSGRATVGIAARFGDSGRSRQTNRRRADNQHRP
jgi:hypothetical protein